MPASVHHSVSSWRLSCSSWPLHAIWLHHATYSSYTLHASLSLWSSPCCDYMKIGFQANLNNLAVGVPHSSTWQCRFLASSLCGSPYQFLDSPCQLQILASPCQPRSITLSVLGASAAVPGLSMPASVCGHHYISLCQLPFQQIGFQAKLNNLAWQCGLLSLCPFLVQFIANPYQCTVSAADHISSWSHCATYST